MSAQKHKLHTVVRKNAKYSSWKHILVYSSFAVSLSPNAKWSRRYTWCNEMNLDSAAKMTRGRHRKQDFGSEIRVGDETRVLSLLENGKMNIFQGVSYRPAKFQGFPNAVCVWLLLWTEFVNGCGRLRTRSSYGDAQHEMLCCYCKPQEVFPLVFDNKYMKEFSFVLGNKTDRDDVVQLVCTSESTNSDIKIDS